MKIKYDINLMKFISLFEQITRAKVKDCIDSLPLTFIVYPGEIAKAIGKKAVNIHKMENLLHKKIKVVEFNDDVLKFVENVIAPIKVEEVVKEGDVVIIRDHDTKKKGMIIGRDASNLNKYKDIVKRYFDVDIVVK